jgi:regulator of replication initiation timing
MSETRAIDPITDVLDALLEDRNKLRGENQQLRDWGQQVHDALDGRELPPYPDEAPARISAVRAENQQLRIELKDLDRRLHAHLSGAEIQQLRDALQALIVWAAVHGADPAAVTEARAALDGMPSEDTE